MDSYIVDKTYHSIPLRNRDGDTITKCLRQHPDLHILARWRKEVCALTRVGVHVRT